MEVEVLRWASPAAVFSVLSPGIWHHSLHLLTINSLHHQHYIQETNHLSSFVSTIRKFTVTFTFELGLGRRSGFLPMKQKNKIKKDAENCTLVLISISSFAFARSRSSMPVTGRWDIRKGQESHSINLHSPSSCNSLNRGIKSPSVRLWQSLSTIYLRSWKVDFSVRRQNRPNSTTV